MNVLRSPPQGAPHKQARILKSVSPVGALFETIDISFRKRL